MYRRGIGYKLRVPLQKLVRLLVQMREYVQSGLVVAHFFGTECSYEIWYRLGGLNKC